MNKHKKEQSCPSCDGIGYYYQPMAEGRLCGKCNGTGKIKNENSKR